MGLFYGPGDYIGFREDNGPDDDVVLRISGIVGRVVIGQPSPQIVGIGSGAARIRLTYVELLLDKRAQDVRIKLIHTQVNVLL